MTLFVDTSVFYAAADRSDAGNAAAKATLGSGESLLTSDHVLVESWLLLQRRLGRASAEQWWRSIRSGACQVESVIDADLAVAWAIGEAYSDQPFSIVDRTSFAVMQRLGITRAATLDADFRIFRYGPRRERAFEVLP